MAITKVMISDTIIPETSGDPAAFFAGPKHPYSRSLVAEARKMELDPSA